MRFRDPFGGWCNECVAGEASKCISHDLRSAEGYGAIVMTKKQDEKNCQAQRVYGHRLYAPATASDHMPAKPDYTVHIYNTSLRRGLGSRPEDINA